MDELKKYLFDHRDKLDVEKPPSPRVWQNIVQSPVTGRRVVSMAVRWLAAACVILAAGITVYFYLLKPVKKPDTASAVPKHSMSPAPESLSRTDSSSGVSPYHKNETATASARNTRHKKTGTMAMNNHTSKKGKKTAPAQIKTLSPIDALQEDYNSFIGQQLKQLESTPIYAENPDYFHVFKKQWYDLEKDEQKTKQDTKQNGFNDNSIDQLMRIYKQKLLLLKQLQNEINKMNNRVKQYPSNQLNKPMYLKM